jgi:hypothetical protein
MTATRIADVVVHGLPYRIRSGADHEEAKALWEAEAERYFYNHAEIACTKLFRLVEPHVLTRLELQHKVDEDTIQGLKKERDLYAQERDAARVELERAITKYDNLKRTTTIELSNVSAPAPHHVTEPLKDGWYWVRRAELQPVVMRYLSSVWYPIAPSEPLIQLALEAAGYRVICRIDPPGAPAKS